MTLTEFLTARWDEIESAAREAGKPAYPNEGQRTFYSTPGPKCDNWGVWTYHVPPAYVLADIAAKRAILAHETRPLPSPEWTPDCGGDWCLNVGALSHEPGLGAFANYWPDNTVSASVYVDGEDVADSGIVARPSRAACQAFAEEWIAGQLPNASPILRALALPFADHEDYDERWRIP